MKAKHKKIKKTRSLKLQDEKIRNTIKSEASRKCVQATEQAIKYLVRNNAANTKVCKDLKKGLREIQGVIKQTFS
tara:strand:+ start:29 stop:253 length:225 start_codon:yes stop_codon:yes gene_type:complete